MKTLRSLALVRKNNLTKKFYWDITSQLSWMEILILAGRDTLMRQQSFFHFQNARGGEHFFQAKYNELFDSFNLLRTLPQQHFTSFCLIGKNLYVVIVMFSARQLLKQANDTQPPPQRIIRLLNQSVPACLCRAVTGDCALPSPVTEQHLQEWLEIIKPHNVRGWKGS